MSDAALATALDLERLQMAQDTFARSSGLALITVGCTGAPLTAASRFTPFCAMMRSDPEQRLRCQKCDAHGGLQSVVEGVSSVYRCHTGLVDFSVPIMQDDAYLGAILCGQVRVEDAPDLPWVTSVNSAWRRDDDLERAWHRVPGMDLAQVHRRASELTELASDLLLRRRRARRPAPSLVPETFRPEAETRRRSRVPAEALEASMERQDLVAEMKILNAALDNLFSDGLRRISPSLLQPLEDAIIRASEREAGAVGVAVRHRVFRHRALGYAHVGRMQCQLYLEGLLFTHMDAVVADRMGPPGMTDLMNLIERNLCTPPSQQRAAKLLTITPSHFSKTFKARAGQTYVSYVTGRKIERACLLLQHSNMPVNRIAADLGFQPVNYFSRQFKRSMGMTPSDYRRRWQSQEDHDERLSRPH